MDKLNPDQVRGVYQEIGKHTKYYLHRGEAMLVEKIVELAQDQYKDDLLIQAIDIEKRGKTDELIREDAITALRVIMETIGTTGSLHSSASSAYESPLKQPSHMTHKPKPEKIEKLEETNEKSVEGKPSAT